MMKEKPQIFLGTFPESGCKRNTVLCKFCQVIDLKWRSEVKKAPSVHLKAHSGALGAERKTQARHVILQTRSSGTLHHRHTGNTLSMVVLPGGQCKQPNKCLSYTRAHTHTHTHTKNSAPYMHPQSPLSKQPLQQAFVNRVGGYLDTTDLFNWTRNTRVNTDLWERCVRLLWETLTLHFCERVVGNVGSEIAEVTI